MENNRDEFPHLSHSGNRAINEIQWQIDENPRLTMAEREWFRAVLHLVCDQFMSYEEAVQATKMAELRNPQFEGDEIGNWLDSDERKDDVA